MIILFTIRFYRRGICRIRWSLTVLTLRICFPDDFPPFYFSFLFFYFFFFVFCRRKFGKLRLKDDDGVIIGTEDNYRVKKRDNNW